MEEILVTLAKIYESNYPLSDRVKTVLEEKYSTSEVTFKNEFAHRTLTLLGSLKEKGFPFSLTEKWASNQSRQMTVLHLVKPVDRLQSGEFYFQIGHTTPGTLALKFAMYESNGKIKTQNSTVEEIDYDCAFSPDFFTHLREKNSLGDGMFRTLIVLPDGSDEVERLQAIDYFRACPEERRGRFSTGSHLSIEESCEEESSKATLARMPSENDGE